jgi:hypothetical protein
MEADIAAIDPDDPEAVKSVVKIQATFRGMQGRKKAKKAANKTKGKTVSESVAEPATEPVAETPASTTLPGVDSASNAPAPEPTAAPTPEPTADPAPEPTAAETPLAPPAVDASAAHIEEKWGLSADGLAELSTMNTDVIATIRSAVEAEINARDDVVTGKLAEILTLLANLQSGAPAAAAAETLPAAAARGEAPLQPLSSPAPAVRTSSFKIRPGSAKKKGTFRTRAVSASPPKAAALVELAEVVESRDAVVDTAAAKLVKGNAAAVDERGSSEVVVVVASALTAANLDTYAAEQPISAPPLDVSPKSPAAPSAKFIAQPTSPEPAGAFFEVLLQYPAVEQRDRCERAVVGLIAERHQQQSQIASSIERAKRLTWSELSKDPTLVKICERQATTGATLLEQLDVLDELNSAAQPVKVVWELDDGTATELVRIEVVCGAFSLSLPATARQTVLDIPPGASVTIEVKLSFQDGAVLVSSAEADLSSAGPIQLHHACNPRMCRSVCRPFAEVLAKEADRHGKAKSKGLRAAPLLRQMRQGKAFPLDEQLLHLQWLGSPVTLVVFVNPQCIPSQSVLTYLRAIMANAAESPHKLMRDARCVVVGCGADDEVAAALGELGCNDMYHCTVVAWERELFLARLKEAHVTRVPHVSVVGVTGNVHWSGTQPLYDPTAFVKAFLHRMNRVTGTASTELSPSHSPTAHLPSRTATMASPTPYPIHSPGGIRGAERSKPAPPSF